MTALHMPMVDVTPRVTSRSHTPWVSALILVFIFAMGNWSFDSAGRWSSNSAADADNLVSRISEGEIGRQLGYALMLCFGVSMCLLPSERKPSAKLRLMYPVVLFVGWAFLSPAWSVDKSQTLKRLIVFAAMVTTVAGFLKHYDISQFGRIALIGGSISMAVGIANEARFIATQGINLHDFRFSGTMHPNHAALNAALVMLSSLYLHRIYKNKWLLVLCGIAAVVLYMTKSRTALMATVTACTAFLFLAAPLSRTGWALLLAAWLGAGLLWLASLEMLPDISGIASMGREDQKGHSVTELTGRTDIWKFALMQAGKDPNRAFIGYGYETFWTPENTRGVTDFVKFRISEGHNVYLDWYLELGFVGVGLYGLIFLTAIARWWTAARILVSPSAAIAAAILIGSIVHGFAESSLGDASLPTLFIYSSIAGAALMRADEMEPA